MKFEFETNDGIELYDYEPDTNDLLSACADLFAKEFNIGNKEAEQIIEELDILESVSLRYEEELQEYFYLDAEQEWRDSNMCDEEKFGWKQSDFV